jgi:hypothetical protein
MRRQPFYNLDGFPEALMAVVFGIIIWGSYGFPHFAKVMLGFVILGCFGAFMWMRSPR